MLWLPVWLPGVRFVILTGGPHRARTPSDLRLCVWAIQDLNL